MISISFVGSRSHPGLYDPIYAPIRYTFELVFLINLCLLSSLCHHRTFSFDRKHRWVQEKLVLLFHFPDRYLLSHANPLTPVLTSAPPTLFTITNVIVLIQGNNAATLGTRGNRCAHKYAFCGHLPLNFKALPWDLIKELSLKSLEKSIYLPYRKMLCSSGMYKFSNRIQKSKDGQR